MLNDDLNTIAVSPNGQRGLIPSYTVWNVAVNYRIGKLERYAPSIFFAVKNLADDTFIVARSRGIMVGVPHKRPRRWRADKLDCLSRHINPDPGGPDPFRYVNAKKVAGLERYVTLN